MFETMVAGWVTIISVSHIPFYLFDIQTVASSLSLACTLQSFFLIALLIFYTGIGTLQCMHALFGSLMSLGPICASFSHYFSYHHITTFHRISLIVFFISSSLFYLLLVLLHILFTLSVDPPQFITQGIVTSFPLSIPQTLIKKSLV